MGRLWHSHHDDNDEYLDDETTHVKHVSVIFDHHCIEANTAIGVSVFVMSISYPLFSDIRIKMIIMMILQMMIITRESYTTYHDQQF